MSEKKREKKEPTAEVCEGAVELTPGVPCEIVGVNFREAGKIYYFSPAGFKLSLGERVIVTTSRGVEIGTVKVPNKMVDPSEIVSPLKTVTRPATPEDLKHDAENHEAEMNAAIICKKNSL